MVEIYRAPLWAKILAFLALSMLSGCVVCIILVEYTELPRSTENLVTTLAIVMFLLWWVLAVLNLAIRAISRNREYSLYYTTVGALILVFAELASVFVPDDISYTVAYAGIVISLLFVAWDIVRIRTRKGVVGGG